MVESEGSMESGVVDTVDEGWGRLGIEMAGEPGGAGRGRFVGDVAMKDHDVGTFCAASGTQVEPAQK